MNKTNLVRPRAADAGPVNTGITNFQAVLRSAIFNAVTEADIIEIVRNQVKLAKEGDKNAIRFVMEYVVGGKGPQMMVQKNILVDRRKMPKPARARPGSAGKLSVLEERAMRGEVLFHPRDGEE